MASFVPYVGFAVPIASGVAGYYLYYRKARQSIERLKEAFPGKDVSAACAEIGGVHRWVIWVGIVVSLLLVVVAFTLGFIEPWLIRSLCRPRLPAVLDIPGRPAVQAHFLLAPNPARRAAHP